MNKQRRQFLEKTLSTACGVGMLGAALLIHSRSSSALPAQAIRPPGALAEEDFLGACIRCGLCVRDCPYDILKLAQAGEDTPIGTPYFTARTAACEMCDDIPCVPACPTGALSHDLTDIEQARMGLAVMIDQEACIAFLGLRCEVCFNICPVRGKAISITRRHNVRSGQHALFIPVVHSEACTGCGKCEQACILEKAAIKVLPTHLAQGQLGEHYRLGWREKQKAGEALVTPDQMHEYNLPEGMHYDHAGEGLMMDDSVDDTPFSSNPLDTLKRGQDTLRSDKP